MIAKTAHYPPPQAFTLVGPSKTKLYRNEAALLFHIFGHSRQIYGRLRQQQHGLSGRIRTHLAERLAEHPDLPPAAVRDAAELDADLLRVVLPAPANERPATAQARCARGRRVELQHELRVCPVMRGCKIGAAQPGQLRRQRLQRQVRLLWFQAPCTAQWCTSEVYHYKYGK